MPAYMALAPVLAALTGLQAGPVDVAPPDPSRGTPLTITYDPGRQGARLKPQDDLHAVIWVHMPGHSSTTQARPMRHDGPVSTLQWTPPPDAIAATFNFITLNMERPYDPSASKLVVLRDPDGSNPRGTGELRVMEAGSMVQVEQIVADERKRHPDSFALYRNKWFVAEFPDFAPGGIKPIIERDLPAIEERLRSHPDDVEARYAFASAAWHLGRTQESIATCEALAAEKPAHPLTSRAASHLGYKIYTMADGDEKTAAKGRFREILRQLVHHAPRCEYARESLSTLADDPDVSLEVIDRVARAWLVDSPGRILALSAMAYARLLRGVELDQAAEFARQSTQSLVSGDNRLVSDISGQIYGFVLPEAYLLEAKIAKARGRSAEAIAAAAAAYAVAPRSGAEPLLIQASCWEAGGDLRRAEKALVRAKLMGSSETDEPLRRIFARRTGSEDGFDAHLTTLLGSSTGDDRPAAPALSGKLLDGTKANLADLKGKVVVLNFWHTRCGPCIAEMPALNTLVESFKGQDVVFWGVTFDDVPTIRAFLEKRQYDYTSVNDAPASPKAFGVIAYPSHFVVDRQGRVAYTRTGGSAAVADELRGVIKALLDQR